MTTANSGRSFWPLRRKQKVVEAQSAPAPAPLPTQDVLLDWDIAPNDPLLAYFHHTSGAIEVNRLHLDSPALRRLKEEGVAMIVPLVSQGELVGIINLGQRRSDQEYSSDDRRLLNDLAVQAAVRRAFDPTGLANPLKVLPSPAACGDMQHVPEGAWV